MPRGKALSEDLQWVIVHMATKMALSAQTITDLTNVPVRTVERTLQRQRHVGTQGRERGQKRVLNYDDLEV
jgi:hypothetical protein